MKRRVEIEAVSLATMILTTYGGEVVPITTLLDNRGDETATPALASMLVAGPMSNGEWIAAEVWPAEREAWAIRN